MPTALNKFEPQNWINSISTLKFEFSKFRSNHEWILWFPSLCRTEKQNTCRNTIAHPDGLNETRNVIESIMQDSIGIHIFDADDQLTCPDPLMSLRAETMHLLRLLWLCCLFPSRIITTEHEEGRGQRRCSTWGISAIAISSHLVVARRWGYEYRTKICHHHGRGQWWTDGGEARD